MRVIIAEDQPVLRAGLIRMLEPKGFLVVDDVDDSDNALLSIRSNKPDVALLDTKLAPDYADGGLVAALAARRERPGQPVIVLAAHVELQQARELMADRLPAFGYMLKHRLFEGYKVLDVMTHVAAGGVFMDAEIVAQLLARRSAPDDPVTLLTPREREIFALMAEGRTTTDIATEVFATDRVTAEHIDSIYRKLGLPQPENELARALDLLVYLDQPA